MTYTCEYCLKYQADTAGALSNHKINCTEKRFLGGQLIIEEIKDNESLEDFINRK